MWLLLPPLSYAAAEAPSDPTGSGYLGTAICADCHTDEHAAWLGSHHDWALKEAADDTVLADFSGNRFDQQGETWRFERSGDAFVARSRNPDGTWQEHKILYAVGVAPLQQYLVMLDGGRLQALTVAWDVEAKQWFHLYPGPEIAEEDGLHWSRTFNNWNSRCADCHSTGFTKGLDPRSGAFDSRWHEANVGCESCHGPGAAHVAWARDPDGPAQQGTKGLTVSLSPSQRERSPGTEIEVCAACHARRQSLGAESRPAGAPFLDHFVPALLREGLYHADGQILDEVYVYGSFLQSRMHAEGVTCSDCHDPHSAQLKAEGNALCTQCHSPAGNSAFPSLTTKTYDSPEHHFHEAGTAGATCVSCHMPARTYMIVDPRRDHSFRVPRPDLSVEIGTPNACTLCHAERDPAWAAQQVAAWYPDGRGGRAHFGEIIAAGRRGEAKAESALVVLAQDEGQPGILRATALDLLRRYGPAAADAAATLLKDPDPLVRRSAVLLQEVAEGPQRVARVAPLLEDPLKAVRIAAARLMVDVTPLAFPAEAVLPFDRAAAEYRTSLLASADLPETQMNIASLALRTGNPRAAEAALNRALDLNGHFEDAWLRLGSLQQGRGRSAEAAASFRAGLARLPNAGSLRRALGLLEIERGDLSAGIEELETAARLLPGDARLHYNLALALARAERPEAAEARMRDSLALAPSDPEILYGLGFLLMEQQRFDEARDLARQLLRLHPQRPEGADLMAEAERRSRR
ncbi:tetratricopeptide repeat protein [Pelagibius sp.]|uniref:tetratricopeptide repeat protein n=1 Tax=Pelagibius sp. TaxID=1931238 RepID=UPI00261C1531|nr:tetratricopeptide repeat protein [Pelagibius sp.]